MDFLLYLVKNLIKKIECTLYSSISFSYFTYSSLTDIAILGGIWDSILFTLYILYYFSKEYFSISQALKSTMVKA